MNFRRYYIPNAIVFITNVVHHREPIFASSDHLELLLSTLREVKKLHPFQMVGYVFMPDHFHLMIRPGDASNFSTIMQSLKSNFTYAYKKKIEITGSLKFWQKRFHDHIIRDEHDFEARLDYIHYNPVKHGYVSRPEDWVHSSFRYWQAKDAYPLRWGWSLPDSLHNFDVNE